MAYNTLDTTGTPEAGDFTKFNDPNTLEGRSATEVRGDLSINNVDNTSDANKPVSTAQQSALDLKADASRVTTLENKNEVYELFENIGSGTSGAITKPEESTILLDRYEGAADALLLATDANGRPIDEPARTAGGDVVTTSLDSSGNYSFSGTPSSYPVSIVYQISIKLVNSDNVSVGQIVSKFETYDADEIGYDNTTSGLSAVQVQEAIDELYQGISTILTVSPDGTGQYTTIQSAIDASNEFDVIRVAPGVYNENLDFSAADNRFLVSDAVNSVTVQGSGTLVTLPPTSMRIYRVNFTLNATSDADTIFGGSPTGEVLARQCFNTVNASTAIKPSYINVSSGRINIHDHGINYNHTHTGSNPGTIDIIKITGTASLVSLHNDISANISQSDGTVNLIGDYSTGLVLTTACLFAPAIINAGFSGVASLYASDTSGISAPKSFANIQVISAGNGSGTYDAFLVTGSGTTELGILACRFSDSGFSTSRAAHATGTNTINYIFADNENHNFGTNVNYTYRNGSGLRTNQDFLDEGMMLIQGGVEPTQNTLQNIISQALNAGWGSGGDITDNTDGSVTIAAGTGFIRTSNSNTAPILSFDWAEDTNVTLVDNAENYVYVDYNAGSPQILSTTTSSTVRDNENDKFELYEVYRNGTTLHITDHKQKANNLGALIQTYLYSKAKIERADAEGGLIIGETGTRNVTVSAGKLLIKLNNILFGSFDSSGADTFTFVWSDGIGGFNETTGNTQWDNAQYDNAGTLTTYGIAKYGYQDVYVEADGNVSVIYPTAQFNSLAAAATASLSPIPVRLEDHALYIGRYYFQAGDATGNPTSSFGTQISGTATTDHGNLAGLADDDHAQYALLAGRSGGQTVNGGTDASDDLDLHSTSNATKGNINLHSTVAIINDGIGADPTLTSNSANQDLALSGNLIVNGAVTINESGADVDFRVEASGQANALFVQGSDGNVGMGIADPDEQLEIAGRFHLGQTSVPGVTTDKLYNVGGNLYWDGLAVGSSWEGANVYYVGKHGNDGSNGLTPDTAFLTIGAAIAAPAISGSIIAGSGKPFNST